MGWTGYHVVNYEKMINTGIKKRSLTSVTNAVIKVLLQGIKLYQQ